MKMAAGSQTEEGTQLEESKQVGKEAGEHEAQHNKQENDTK